MVGATIIVLYDQMEGRLTVSSPERQQEVWVQPVLEGMTEREILEGFNPEQLVEYKGFLLEKYSDLERQVHLVNDILGGYGYEENENIVLGEN